uniref:Uncharacterized protein n=1 Tax=Arundo donax TaxID=35708 RepID=A0A0A9AWP9_ARUDO
MILVGDVAHRNFRGFRFEAFWTKIPGYREVVHNAWSKPTLVFNRFLNLHIKLQRTGKELKLWARSKVGPNKLLLEAAKQLIWILDIVHEYRQLSEEELNFKRELKQRYLGMTTIEKLRAKQQSRLTWVIAGDAGSKLRFLMVNGRRRKNFI